MIRSPFFGSEIPLSPVQALILKTIRRLGDKASAYSVLTELNKAFLNVRLFQPSQIYTTIRLMKTKSEPYIREDGQVPSDVGGPPKTILQLTPAGRRALDATVDHYQQLYLYLSQ